MKTLAEKIIHFNKNLQLEEELPEGFKIINPFFGHPETSRVMEAFYRKYYNDNQERKWLLGINPGRLGAGTTGIPFTDTKRLESVCGIQMKSAKTHEVSAMFIYSLIEAMGGVEKFYRQFYINSPFPLAIVRKNKKEKWVNANYYDDKKLFDTVRRYMVETLKTHLQWELDSSEVFILGKKNAQYIHKLNEEAQFFSKLTALEHPRYIQQYKSKEKDFYIEKYRKALMGN